MSETLLRLVALGFPAVLALAAVIVGRKPVQRLREMTGDESALTRVLGGAAFARDKGRREAL